MENKHWKVKFGGRDLGAIGIMVQREEHLIGPDLEAAILKLYDKYEEVMGLQHMELKDCSGDNLSTEWTYRDHDGTLWGPVYTCPSCGIGRYKKYRGLGEWSHDPYRICTDCGVLGCPECIDEKYVMRAPAGQNRIDWIKNTPNPKPTRIFQCKNEGCKK